jgi:hypothetical protein
MGWLAATWEQVYGLIVDDGWIAAGAIGALMATWAFTQLAAENESLRDFGGPLLMLLVSCVILANLYVAGRRAARSRMN